MRGVDRALTRAGEIRGITAEDLVESCLELMVANGLVSGFERVERCSIDDRRGFDFWVRQGSQRFGFQVKSSATGVNEARRKHPRIPVIKVHVGDQLESICGLVNGVIEETKNTFWQTEREWEESTWQDSQE